MLDLIKRKLPKFYSLSRNFKDQIISKKRTKSDEKFNHHNENNIKSIKDIPYYDHKKTIFEEDKIKKDHLRSRNK